MKKSALFFGIAVVGLLSFGALAANVYADEHELCIDLITRGGGDPVGSVCLTLEEVELEDNGVTTLLYVWYDIALPANEENGEEVEALEENGENEEEEVEPVAPRIAVLLSLAGDPSALPFNPAGNPVPGHFDIRTNRLADDDVFIYDLGEDPCGLLYLATMVVIYPTDGSSPIVAFSAGEDVVKTAGQQGQGHGPGNNPGKGLGPDNNPGKGNTRGMPTYSVINLGDCPDDE